MIYHSVCGMEHERKCGANYKLLAMVSSNES